MTSTNGAPRRVARGVVELITIVVGVLLALAVDQAVENSNNRDLERGYLQRLSGSLARDIETAETDLWRFGFEKTSAEAIYPLVLDPTLPLTDSLGFVVESIIVGFQNWSPVDDATFEELKSTGRLTLIRNEELRAAIGSYYRAREHGNAFVQRAEVSYRYLQQKISGGDAHWIAYDCYVDRVLNRSGQPFDCHPPIPAPVVKRIVERMRGDDEVVGALSQRVYEMDLMIRILERRDADARELRSAVDEELSGN